MAKQWVASFDGVLVCSDNDCYSFVDSTLDCLHEELAERGFDEATVGSDFSQNRFNVSFVVVADTFSEAHQKAKTTLEDAFTVAEAECVLRQAASPGEHSVLWVERALAAV